MVVTRRTPVVPPQQLARNPSSNGVQRSLRTPPNNSTDPFKDTASNVATASVAITSNNDSDHRNGLDNNPGKRSRKFKRRAKNKYQKSNFQAFLDFLTKLLLLAFTIYTFSMCPQDTQLQSPICRGLAEYKRLVLDPYIVPPIQAMLVHPSVTPYVERAKPYVQHAVEITTPILFRTRQEWNLHVVPQWEKRVAPQWNKYIVPQWDKHVVPRLQLAQSKVEPYRQHVIRRYEQRILPHARVVLYNLQRWQRRAEPYVRLAVSKTRGGYYAAKPYVIAIAKRCGHLLQRFALFLREQRQEFVDPHVAKMREKVKELSRGRQVTPEAAPERESPLPEITFTILETLVYETTASSIHPFPGSSIIPTPEEIGVPPAPSSLCAVETAGVTAQPALAEPSFTSVSEPVTPTQLAGTPTGIESFLSAESIHAEFLHEWEPPRSGASVFVEELDAVISSVSVVATAVSSSSVPLVAEEPTNPPSSVTSSKIPVAAAQATIPPASTYADNEIDFDAFYAELGLGEPLENSVNSDSDLPSPPAETEEERAERLRLKADETARRRSDVEVRQTKWEAELQAQMERSTTQLQVRLGNLRTAAAAELPSSVNIRNSIEELVGEAEKYLKGAEIYLKNLKGEGRRSDEKLALWDRVADRVNDKFIERLSVTEGVVNTWYSIMLDRELQEVNTAATAVREVAEKGQLDLGLDYAWLEDVTYNDWQRYHALMGTSEQYAHEAASIQNGTHPKLVVANPLSPSFQDLESEVQDVVIGFETRLRRIKRDGERAFNTHSNGVAPKEEEKGSAVEPEAEPEASILPMPREGAVEGQGFVPPVVIGRNQEEVLEALGRAEPISEADRPVIGSDVDPEEAVSRLAQEAGISHTEL